MSVTTSSSPSSSSSSSPSPSSINAAIKTAVTNLEQSSGAGTTMNGTTAATDAGAELLASLHSTLVANPKLLSVAIQKKAFVAPPTLDEAAIASKDFWSTLGDVVTTFVPMIVDAVNKDFTPKEAVVIPPTLAADKDFWDFLGSALQVVVPPLVGAISGAGKDFNPGTIELPAIPANKPKNWLSDAVNVVVKVAPSVLPFVLAAL